MPFKILTYHASIDCDGSMEEKKKLMDLAVFIKERQLDIAIILGISGMKGQESIFKIFKKQSGFEFGNHFDYNHESLSMLYLSKEPYDIHQHEEMINLHYAMEHIYYPQMDLAVFPIHMTPNDTATRYIETDFVEEIVESAEANRVILAGTFNALPPEFCLEAGEDFFNGGAEYLYKYCSQEKAICYHTINRMNAKWVDAFHCQPECLKKKQHTVPTAASQNPAYFHPMRLDYIFMSHALSDCLESCQILCNPTTEQLADHYPVEAVFSSL